VAVTKYQTMDKVSVTQSRLEVVRAVGNIPRYMKPERGFATNILFGPAVVDPKMRTELNDKYRKERRRAGEGRPGPHVGAQLTRRRRRRRQRDRCPEHEIRGAARGH